eukprot:SAG22_NODE_2963_length_2068_cov_1.782123_2_plen_317_part_01
MAVLLLSGRALTPHWQRGCGDLKTLGTWLGTCWLIPGPAPAARRSTVCVPPPGACHMVARCWSLVAVASAACAAEVAAGAGSELGLLLLVGLTSTCDIAAAEEAAAAPAAEPPAATVLLETSATYGIAASTYRFGRSAFNTGFKSAVVTQFPGLGLAPASVNIFSYRPGESDGRLIFDFTVAVPEAMAETAYIMWDRVVSNPTLLEFDGHTSLRTLALSPAQEHDGAACSIAAAGSCGDNGICTFGRCHCTNGYLGASCGAPPLGAATEPAAEPATVRPPPPPAAAPMAEPPPRPPPPPPPPPPSLLPEPEPEPEPE